MFCSEITRVSVDQRYYLRLSTLSTELLLPLISNTLCFLYLIQSDNA